MGNCFAPKNSNSESTNLKLNQQQLQQYQIHSNKKKTTSKGIGLGVAMMMQQAAQISNSAAARPTFDLANLHNEMRKAKAEGRTVTIINGCVYFDYQFVAQLPPNCDLSM